MLVHTSLCTSVKISQGGTLGQRENTNLILLNMNDIIALQKWLHSFIISSVMTGFLLSIWFSNL